MFVRKGSVWERPSSRCPQDVKVELCSGKINKFRGVFGIGCILGVMDL